MASYDPYQHAEELGVRVIHRRLRTGTGLWVPDIGVIFIQDHLRRVQDRSTLAHELGHADLGHLDDRPKHELQADRYAAEHLIDENELVDVMKWCPDISMWANALDVSTKLIRVYWNIHGSEIAV